MKTSESLNMIPKPVECVFHDLWIKSIVSIDLYLGEKTDHVSNAIIHLEMKFQTKVTLYSMEKDSTLHDEGYRLKITVDGVSTLHSNSLSGVWHAISTLTQLHHDSGFPVINIMDYPRFPHRGLLLDCCRHFFDVDFILRYIDILSLLKMSVLHWHLTDDQGWRIQIDRYPLLTEIGAYRDENGVKYGGFYTKDDIRKVCDYARSRCIRVIPEIEMPGHALAAIASYPELSCFPGKLHQVPTTWGVFKEVYCAGSDFTFEFIENVLEEVLDLFDSPLIHIGGDECPKDNWKECKRCQQRIIDENLQNEDELQSWLVKRIGNLLKKRRTIVGWDEILDGGIEENAVIQSWRGMQGGVEAVKCGHKAIMSPTSHCYFDYDIQTIDLRRAYTFEPVPKSITDKEANLIIGGECNLWSERIIQSQVDERLFPRILAISESLWSKSKDSYEVFLLRCRNLYPLLSKLGIKIGPESKPVSLFSHEYEGGNMIELVAGEQDLVLYYNLDGQTISYQHPFMLKQDVAIKAFAKRLDQVYGDIVEFLSQKNLICCADLIISPSPSEKYPGISLTNGVNGPLNHHDPQWMGWISDIVNIITELKNPIEVSSLTFAFLVDTVSWIFPPKTIEIGTVKDEKYLCIGNLSLESTSNVGILPITITFEKQILSSIQIKIATFGSLRLDHPGAGQPAWLFLSQILVQ